MHFAEQLNISKEPLHCIAPLGAPIASYSAVRRSLIAPWKFVANGSSVPNRAPMTGQVPVRFRQLREFDGGFERPRAWVALRAARRIGSIIRPEMT